MDPLSQIAQWLAESERAVAFTGAGISTESGIPDFRSPNGIWAQSQPVQYQDFLSSPDARYEYWRQKSISHADFEKAKPNAAHNLLAAWESDGRLRGLITQNIDGLHQLAGSKQVWELHGSARQVGCLNCEQRWEADPWVRKFLEEDQVPSCPECGGVLKHATISFGQSLPSQVLFDASHASRQADLFLALGSSLVVYPAAGLPESARRNGARLVIINRMETPLDSLADVVLRTELGPTLTEIDRRLRESDGS